MTKFTNAGPGRAEISNRNKALPTAIARRLALTQYAQRHPFKIPNASKVQMHPATPFPTDARSTAIKAKSRTVKNQNPARVRTIFGRFAITALSPPKFHARARILDAQNGSRGRSKVPRRTQRQAETSAPSFLALKPCVHSLSGISSRANPENAFAVPPGSL